MIHVAVVHRTYVPAILDGSKTIESRLSRNRCAPWNKVSVGDTIYFKQSSGPFKARATVRRVHQFDNLTAHRIAQLRRTYNHSITGPPHYWRAKRQARFATLIWFHDIHPADSGPAIPPLHGRGWIVLTNGTSP